jgi:hypothetical protein
MNDALHASGTAALMGTLGAWLAPILASRGTTLDAAQAAACDRL